ncbi:MAG TPA: helix-turn-helix domain-containing protein, partial [Flavobacteriales bacterium]|nr:helix-turn-helix domain-containing protein [Flavobacteriales bacterium]
AILKRLSSGEARVTEVARPFSMSLNAISKHILVLERAKLVKRRKVGRDHFLSYRAEPLDAAAKWIDETRDFWASRLDALEQLLRAEDAARK